MVVETTLSHRRIKFFVIYVIVATDGCWCLEDPWHRRYGLVRGSCSCLDAHFMLGHLDQSHRVLGRSNILRENLPNHGLFHAFCAPRSPLALEALLLERQARRLRPKIPSHVVVAHRNAGGQRPGSYGEHQHGWLGIQSRNFGQQWLLGNRHRPGHQNRIFRVSLDGFNLCLGSPQAHKHAPRPRIQIHPHHACAVRRCRHDSVRHHCIKHNE
mmetsp:Transcript_12868/g.30087  ORF Transcript_12868/g.30087 Transcript_12868/m.30087 type:complete len:213 (+) Transcript_12868:1380-2018(+)